VSAIHIHKMFITYHLLVLLYYNHLSLLLLCQDVIGVVQDMGYSQLNEGNGKKLQVNFTMRDLRCLIYNYI